MVDIIIKNGTLLDGSGAPRYLGDVAIKDGLIVDIAKKIDYKAQRQIVKDFLIKFTKNLQKGARSTVWLLTPRLIDYIFPFSRSLQRYA